MTQEDLIRQICNWFSNDGYDNHKIKDVTEKLTQFFESNICIPIGTNRHHYADVLHALAEGSEIEQKTDRGTWIEVMLQNDEYRIKPAEPVYEWQWLDQQHILDENEYSYCNARIMSQGKYMTSKEANALTCYGNIYLIEETKRIRK